MLFFVFYSKANKRWVVVNQNYVAKGVFNSRQEAVNYVNKIGGTVG